LTKTALRVVGFGGEEDDELGLGGDDEGLGNEEEVGL